MWLFTPPKTEKGNSKKLQIRYDKLVYIKEKCPMNTYRVIDKNTHIELKHLVHSDRLKPYYPELDSFPDRIIGGQVIDDVTEDEDNKNDDNAKEEHVTKEDSNVKTSTTMEEDEQQGKAEPKQKKTVDKNQKDNDGWYEAKRLLSAKMINNKRFYEVEWADGSAPTFEKEEDVTDFLKQEFHRTRTLGGRLRQNRIHKFGRYDYK